MKPVISDKSANPKTFPPESPGQPDQLTVSGDRLIIVSHSPKMLTIQAFNSKKEVFKILHRFEYPFGNTRFGTRNNSFYLSGQFGDTIYDLSKIKTASDGKMWIIDFLSGELFIIQPE